MKDQLIAFATCSPQDLAKEIAETLKESKVKPKYIALAISGQDVLVQPFSIANIPVKEIRNYVQLEAVGLLSLPVDEVAYDFQIFQSKNDTLKGVFACAPKALMKEYLDIVEASELSPLTITPYILASSNSFFLQHSQTKERSCLLDFTPKHYVNLAVFNHLQFELLRKVPFETFEEAKSEIVRSLRSANAKSARKDLDLIHFTGDVEEDNPLIPELGAAFKTKTHFKPFHNVKEALCHNTTFFSVNLLRQLTYSQKDRRLILQGLNLVLLAFFLGCGLLGWQMFEKQKTINDLHQTVELLQGHNQKQELVKNDDIGGST